MHHILKHRLKTLYYEESGVALAFSVIVFLFLYLFGMGVYAMGDTVQKRVRLQNAVDAASYSGAVVQADTLSRIAVINKAMAWTYVMQTRMQMDYIVHKWLGNTIKTWDVMDQIVRMINAPSCHANHIITRDYCAGVGRHGQILLSPSGRSVNINSIKTAHNVRMPAHMTAQNIGGNLGSDAYSAIGNIFSDAAQKIEDVIDNNRYGRKGKKFRTDNAQTQIEDWVLGKLSGSYPTGVGGTDATGRRLGTQITTAKNNIIEMNRAVVDLQNNMKSRIESAIEQVMNMNYPEAQFKSKVSSADQYMVQLNSGDERHFLNFAQEFRGKAVSSASVMNKGAGLWMKIVRGNGISRTYPPDLLTATWYNSAKLWIHPPYSSCISCPVSLDPSIVTAEGSRDSYYTGEAAKPLVLTRNYFQPDGAIVVAASVPLVNPFASWGDVSKGLFSAFTVGGGSQKIMAVSAARAGYRDHYANWSEGEYRNRQSCKSDSYIKESWNLCEADWDAMFLPVNNSETISADNFNSLMASVGSTNFVPKKASIQNTKRNFKEAIKHVFH